MPIMLTLDGSLSHETDPKKTRGLLGDIAKGFVSAYRGFKTAQHTVWPEDPYEVLGGDAAPNLRFKGEVYTPQTQSRFDPHLTPEAMRDIYRRPEVSFGTLAGRTKDLPLDKLNALEEGRKIGQANWYAFARRHYK